MKNYIKHLKRDLRAALQNLHNPETFGALYGYGFEEGDLSEVPVKTLAEWLGIDLTTLPPSDRLSEQQQAQVAKVLLSYWTNEDELAFAIRFAEPKRRYEMAIEYISMKARYDGYGGFEIDEPPLTPEQLRNIRSPLDDLVDKYGDDLKPLPDNERLNNELPF